MLIADAKDMTRFVQICKFNQNQPQTLPVLVDKKSQMPSTEKGPDVINSETTTTAAVSVTADKVETASYCLEVANIDDRSR